MRRSINITFKDNSDEIKLYEYIKSKSSATAYIKDLLKKDLESQEDKKNKLLKGYFKLEE